MVLCLGIVFGDLSLNVVRNIRYVEIVVNHLVADVPRFYLLRYAHRSNYYDS